MSAAAPITTPAGIQSGIAVTNPASAAVTRILRALGTGEREGRAGERERDDGDREDASSAGDHQHSPG